MNNNTLEYIQLSIKDKLTASEGVEGPSRVAIIKPVFRPSAQGRHLRNVRGQSMQQNRARTAAYHFSPLPSISKRLLNTGFWEKISNPYKVSKESQSELPSVWKERGIWEKDKISIQEYLEIKYGKEPGYYTSEMPNIKQRKGAVQTYLQSFTFPLGDTAVVLDLDSERGEIMYLLALRAKKIANSVSEINTNVHSHYISKVNEGEIEKAKKTETYENAVAKLVDLKNNYDGETVKKFAVVLGLIKSTDMAVNAVKNQLSDFINDNKYKYDNINEFNELYDLFKGNKNDIFKFETMYLLDTLTNNRIITVSKGKHMWGNAPEESVQTIGLSKEFAIKFLLDPEMKEWRSKLCTELKSKTGIILK